MRYNTDKSQCFYDVTTRADRLKVYNSSSQKFKFKLC